MAGMVYNTVELEEQEIVEAFKKVMEAQPKMKVCKLCVSSDEPCTWCHTLKIPIHPFSYGCKHHKTKDEAIVEHIRAERARGARVTERIRNKLAVKMALTGI